MLLIFFTRYWHIFSFLLDADIAVFILCNQAHPERWGLYPHGKQSGDQKLLHSPWSRSSAAAPGGAGSVRNVAWLRASRGAAPSAVKDGKTAPASGFSMINAISVTGGRGCETLCEINLWRCYHQRKWGKLLDLNFSSSWCSFSLDQLWASWLGPPGKESLGRGVSDESLPLKI